MARFGAGQTGNAIVEFDCIALHRGVDYVGLSFESFESFAPDVDCPRGIARLFTKDSN